MFVLDPAGDAGGVPACGVETEPGLDFGPEMAGMIGGGDHFDVGAAGARTLVEFILDARIGNLNLVVEKWKVLFLSDLPLDLIQIAVGFSFPRSVDGLLYLRLQFNLFGSDSPPLAA
jgi:hypothetical protein